MNIMTDTHHEAERERALAQLRILRLDAQLFIARVDNLGLLLRDNLISPWGALAAISDLYDRPDEGAEQ